MSDPYVGEIRMFAGNFAPAGWAICNGSMMSIAENQVLFSLLGTTYGGDGVTSFALPDLQGRAPMHRSQTYSIGAKGGTESVTLTTTQMPVHTHLASASSAAADATNPSGMLWAKSTYNSYAPTPNTAMSATTVAGASQPHDNMMPSLAVSFIIALNGIYPSTN